MGREHPLRLSSLDSRPSDELRIWGKIARLSDRFAWSERWQLLLNIGSRASCAFLPI